MVLVRSGENRDYGVIEYAHDQAFLGASLEYHGFFGGVDGRIAACDMECAG